MARIDARFVWSNLIAKATFENIWETSTTNHLSVISAAKNSLPFLWWKCIWWKFMSLIWSRSATTRIRKNSYVVFVRNPTHNHRVWNLMSVKSILTFVIRINAKTVENDSVTRMYWLTISLGFTFSSANFVRSVRRLWKIWKNIWNFIWMTNLIGVTSAMHLLNKTFVC